MYEKLNDYEIYVGSKCDLILIIDKYLCKKFNENKLNIVSGNPEVLLNSEKLESLNGFLDRKETLIIPDGIGVVLLLKILKKNITQKIAGIEIMEEVLKICDNNNLKIYFLGATKENLKLAIKNIQLKYQNIKVCGYNDGYFDNEKVQDIVLDINRAKPDVLFVAMGSPRQEIFINKYIDELNCRLFMGVGGSFDLYAGQVKRAPKIMINLGLEWLYRVVNEPFRIKRLSSIPKFIFRSINYHLKGKS